MKLFFTLLLSGILLHINAPGQDTATFQVRYYGTENGLPSNGIKGLQWDEQTGFLWLATEAGIVRFNGIDFKTFTRENTPFIASERIVFMIRNNKGAIYAADLDGNVILVDKNKLAPYPVRVDYSSPFPYGLIISDTFSNYKTDHPGGRFDPGFLKIIPLTDTSLLVIEPGKLSLISKTAENRMPLSFGNIRISSGFKIGNKTFLLSDNNDVFLFDITNQKLLPVKVYEDDEIKKEADKKQFYYFWQNNSANTIAIKNNQAWLLEYTGTEIKARELCQAVPVNALIRFAEYSEEKKILFLGTDSKGLIVITRNRVDVIRKKQMDINTKTSYYSQIEMPGNAILTSEGDVLGDSHTTGQPLPIKGKLSFNLYTTPDSLLWYAQVGKETGFNFLHCYNYKTGQTTAYPKIPIENNFGLARSNKNTYIATIYGFGILDEDTIHYLYRNPPKNEGFAPFNMLEIAPGVLGIACCNGLFRYNTNSSVLDTMLRLPGYCIRALWKYNDYLFIGTYGKGFYIYKNGKLKAMPLDKNNYLAYVHCFIPDRFGYCWMSTNRGLFKSSLEELINAFETKSNNVYYHYIGRNDGMETTEMNGGCTPCALEMKNGTFSFPTMDGLLWANPQNAVPVLPDGEVFIDEVKVDNENIETDSLEEKKFSANTKEILIQLGFAAWSNKENLYIEYQVNDTLNWKLVDLDNDPVIRLYNLSAGNYKLRIRKRNGFGISNYSYKDIHFRIRTPWYRQWWFYILAALVALGIGRLYFKLRTKQYVIQQRKLEQQVFEKTRELQQKNEILEKNDTIKTRLISIISHDIVTPLKFLTVAGKNLLQKRELMSEELQQETIGEMTNTSQDLQLLTTNILNWIKYQNENRRLLKETFNAHELINQVLSILTSLAKQKQIQLSNEVDKHLLLYQYAEPLKILVYNLVSNAIQFSEQGRIVISNKQGADNTIIIVKDEGLGMSPEQIHNIMSDQVIISSDKMDNRKGNGLGYLIIKDLIKMIGGFISIESKKGKGTSVSVHIPVRQEKI